MLAWNVQLKFVIQCLKLKKTNKQTTKKLSSKRLSDFCLSFLTQKGCSQNIWHISSVSHVQDWLAMPCLLHIIDPTQTDSPTRSSFQDPLITSMAHVHAVCVSSELHSQWDFCISDPLHTCMMTPCLGSSVSYHLSKKLILKWLAKGANQLP